jgi:hypothetical protein
MKRDLMNTLLKMMLKVRMNLDCFLEALEFGLFFHLFVMFIYSLISTCTECWKRKRVVDIDFAFTLLAV